jgi:hypothetical protein
MKIIVKGQFPYFIREAMQVAYALASEIEKNQPVLLSVNSKNPRNQIFRFQGGLVTYIEMINIGTSGQRQKWAVTGAHVKTRTSEKIFTSEDLLALKKTGKFWTIVQDLNDIISYIGVFDNASAGEAFYTVDPSYRQNGCFTLIQEIKYHPYVVGSLEAAEKTAAEAVEKLTTNNVVALFENNSCGEYEYIVNPVGNYKGSKYYPLSFMCEISFDPSVEGSKEVAIKEAETWIEENSSILDEIDELLED